MYSEDWKDRLGGVEEKHGGVIGGVSEESMEAMRWSTFVVQCGGGTPQTARESLDWSMAEMLILRSEKEEGQGKRSILQLNTNGGEGSEPDGTFRTQHGGVGVASMGNDGVRAGTQGMLRSRS